MAEVLGTVLFSAFGTTITVGTLVSTFVLPLAIRALTPKPKAPQIKQGIIVNSRDAIAPHDYVYGTVRKGGTITYMEATGDSNRFLHMILVLAGHEVNAINDIYINDQVVTLDGNGFVTSSPWNSKIRIRKHLGSPTQTVDSVLLSESSQINSNFRGQGIAYLYIRLEYDQDVFPSGIPLFSAVVEGRKVFDPRTSTTGFSSNAALCVRDYITGEYGLDADSVDDVYFSASANVSDENLPLSGGGTEKRYTMNGVITADTPLGDVLQAMMTTCGGTLWWGQGTWKFKVGYYTSPTKTLTLDDLRGPLNVQTRQAINDNFNTVRGTFNDAAQDWIEVDYPEVTAAGFVAEDNGEVSSIDLSLPLTTSSASAQRLAKLALFRGREQITFTADFGMSAFDVEVGDIIAFTNSRYGWNAKEFEVVEWVFFPDQETGELKVTLTLRETSSAAFAWDAEETDIISNNTTLPNAFRAIPVGISLSSETRVANEKITNVIFVTVTSSEAFNIDRVEVQFKKASDTNWSVVGVGDVGTYEIIDVGDDTYDVRVRSYSVLGIRSDFVTYDGFVVSGLANPPQDVSGLAAEINGASVHLEWTPVLDLDLSFYRIRHAVEETGATWANATTAVEKVPRPGNAFTVPAKPGTYMIRAFDKTSNASVNYTSIVVPEAALEDFTNVLTQTEDPTFSGTKTDCSVVSNELQITDVSGTAPFLATYEFSNYIDTGAVRRFRSRIDLATRREDKSAGLFDDLPGLFDSLPGLFDDFTGAAQFDDTNVVTYISLTNDDPAGTPTWGPWQKFRAGDFYARAARYKIELLSSDTDVTPSVSSLQALVRYN